MNGTSLIFIDTARSSLPDAARHCGAACSLDSPTNWAYAYFRMKAQPDEIESAALELDPALRLRIAHALVRSLESEDPEIIRALWIDEAEHRDTEMDEGSVDGIPGDEVLARVRSKYR